MIHQFMEKVRILHNATRIFHQWFRIDARGDGTAGIDFRHDFRHAIGRKDSVGAVFANGGIGKVRHGRTGPIVRTRATRVEGRTGGINVFAKAVGRVRRTGQVGLTGIVGDEPLFLNKFIGASVTASMTRACRVSPTIENELNGEINFIARGVASNLDAIGQGRECTVRPTGTTVLRNVLIQTLCEVRLAIDIGPREVGWQVILRNVRVGKGRGVVVANVMVFENLVVE